MSIRADLPALKVVALLAGLAAATPLTAQEVMLPSGLTATLFDVVLEAEADPDAPLTAPDAFTDPEGEEGEATLADLDEADGAGEAAPGLTPEAAPSDADPLGAPLPGPPEGGLARFRLTVPGLGSAGADYDTVAPDFAWLCAELALPALAANGWTPTEVVVSLSDRETAFGVLDPGAVQFFEGFRIGEGACVPQAF